MVDLLHVYMFILTLCFLEGQADINDFILNRVSLKQQTLILFTALVNSSDNLKM